MTRQDVCWLIAEDPQAHGLTERVPETERMVYCTVRSVSYREVYEGMARGMNPEIIIGLSDMEEYNAERLIRWNGTVWRVIRHYMTGNGGIELTLERKTA